MSKKENLNRITLVACGTRESNKSKIVDIFRFGIKKREPFYKATLPVEYRTATVTLNEKKHKLNIWDLTISKHLNKEVRRAYLKNLNVMMCFFDISDEKSFEELQAVLEKHKELEVPKILVAVNSDPTKDRAISEEVAKKYAEENNMHYVEVSSETGQNVQFLFEGATALANNEEWIFEVEEENEEDEEDDLTKKDGPEDHEELSKRQKHAFDNLMTYARFLSDTEKHPSSKNDNNKGKSKGTYLQAHFPEGVSLGSKEEIESMLKYNSGNVLDNRNNSGIKWYKVRSFFLCKRNKFQGWRLCESRTEELLVDAYKSLSK